jgi:hypothetical protein
MKGSGFFLLPVKNLWIIVCGAGPNLNYFWRSEMCSIPWLAEEVFVAIRQFELTSSFCDLGERKQTQILGRHLSLRSSTIASPFPAYTRQPGSIADLIVETEDGDRIVCELKGMYKTFFKANKRPYPAYLWSPFKNPSKDDSAGHDLRKLADFTGPDTTHVAQILVGSAVSQDRLANDFTEYARLA